MLRTSFWYTMAAATAGLVVGLILAEPIGALLGIDDPTLVRAAFVGLWAQMNYEQLTAVFRVEQRPWAFLAASLANIAITVGATVALRRRLRVGRRRRRRRELHRHAARLPGAARRTAASSSASSSTARSCARMQRFGLPLVPSALALIVVELLRPLLPRPTSPSLAEVGLYEIGARIASAMVLLLTAFRAAWPAFAYSIEDDAEAQRTYAFVLTYLIVVATWLAVALGAARAVARAPARDGGSSTPASASSPRSRSRRRSSPATSSSRSASAARSGRSSTGSITGAAAALNVALNLAPRSRSYGMEGAAAATVASYALLFVGMAWWARRVYPVPYQWRRVGTALAAGVALVVVGEGARRAARRRDPARRLVYPLALLPLGFLLPGERARLRTLARLRSA